MTSLLSSLHRPQIISKLRDEPYDLIIIGGGITGAGIALDASSRGMKVALVEKNDFASGTSSRSTKLVHGGLRYLKQFEISLVREVGRERATVHKLAPHLVTAEKMLLPITEDGTFGKFSTSIGLMVYDVLAGVEKADQRKMLSKEETLELEPLLNQETVEGSGLYAEYRTDDARLTIEIIKTASKYGATSLNYCEVQDFLYNENGKVEGVKCIDNITKNDFNINGKVVVSAAGPWVDNLREINNSMNEKHLFLSKGVHIVVSHEKFPLIHSVYFDAHDSRMIFAIPRGKITYIGTTDTPYKGNINHIVTNLEDVDYLLEATNIAFPKLSLEEADVISSWAGVRPLIFEDGKDASEISRKDEIFESPNGLLSIAGGKLTGYRKMAEKIVNLTADKLKQDHQLSFKECFTEQIHFSGGPFKDESEVNEFRGKIAERIIIYGLNKYYALYLVANYGKQTEQILDIFLKLDENDVEVRIALAELRFCVHNELTFSILDFFMRRTGRLYFDIKSINKLIEPILEAFKSYFNWTSEKVNAEKMELEKAIFEASNFEYSKHINNE